MWTHQRTTYAVLCLYRNLNLFLRKCTKTVATIAVPFGSDMHQIVCRLGLRTRPHWGSLQRSPRPPSWFRGWGPGGKGRREGGGNEGRGGEESRNAQNPELASLILANTSRQLSWKRSPESLLSHSSITFIKTKRDRLPERTNVHESWPHLTKALNANFTRK